ncbi:MAG TPA: hypothetical protein VN782_11970 [Usitatibacter sp.]|nr:hypothetical protein [Usitatibacter sp.]
MNARACPSPGACWRQRFLAIARQAEAGGSRAAAAGLRVRTRPGFLGGARRIAAASRP